jgi:hypothetical protein
VAAVVTGLWLLATATATYGHHSFAPLLKTDGEETLVTIDGIVRVYRLLNPHGAIIIDAVAEDGSEQPWLIELSPAAQLAREGWTPETMQSGDSVSVAILASMIPNRGRLRAMLVHGRTANDNAQLLVAYGIRGNTPVMQRLRERLPVCGTIDPSYNRTECFLVSPDALAELEAEFPGHMGYVLP